MCGKCVDADMWAHDKDGVTSMTLIGCASDPRIKNSTDAAEYCPVIAAMDMLQHRTDRKLETALIMATNVHAGVCDLVGVPIIVHIMHVVSDRELPSERHWIVAALHEIVKDGECDLSVIRAVFGGDIADDVDAISHRKNEPLVEYYDRVLTRPVATTVKKADLRHDSGRLWRIEDEELRARLEDKYVKAQRHFGMSDKPLTIVY